MSAITTAGSPSGYSAIAQLLANSLSNSAAPDASQTGQPKPSQSAAAATSAPTDSVELSDHAKAVLAQAQKDQVAANQLQSFLQSARNPAGTGGNAAPGQTASGISQAFDQLTGQTQQPSQQGNAGSPSLADLQKTDGWLGGLTAYTETLSNASQQPDGTYKNFSQTLNDVIVVPSTPQDIATWYQTEGKSVQSAAQYWPDDNPGLAEAIANHAVTFLNANDIPGLNFHNSIVIQGGGGEIGTSANENGTYNQQAAIFSDPTTSYKVLVNGTVLAWKTPPATATTASN
jgi:hypothetical protein